MGRDIKRNLLFVIGLIVLFGFFPANSPIEKKVVEEKTKKAQNVREKTRQLVVGRYVYRVGTRAGREGRGPIRAEKSNVVEGKKRRKRVSCGCGRVGIGLILLAILTVLSVKFYLFGRTQTRLVSRKGFSLLEILVALGIFSLVIWATSSLLFSVRPFFFSLGEKLTDLNTSRRVQLYLEKILSRACEEETDVIKLYPNKIVFPYCEVSSGSRVVSGHGNIKFEDGSLLVDSTGSGKYHKLADGISSWQVVRNGDKIQVQYKIRDGDSWKFQVAVLTD